MPVDWSLVILGTLLAEAGYARPPHLRFQAHSKPAPRGFQGRPPKLGDTHDGGRGCGISSGCAAHARPATVGGATSRPPGRPGPVSPYRFAPARAATPSSCRLTPMGAARWGRRRYTGATEAAMAGPL